MRSIHEYVKEGVLVFDGAMGTYIASKLRTVSSCEMLSITNPAEVERVHKEYIESGAKAVKTNTFGANYENFPVREDLVRVINASVSCANRAAKDKAYVFASIGPVEGDYGDIPDIFMEAGIENFIFETLCDDAAAVKSAKYIKEKNPNAFIIISFAISPDGFTRSGRSGAQMQKRALEISDMAGFNCVCGPTHMERYITENGLWSRRLSLMPNAGYPTVIGNRTYFGRGEEYYGECLARMEKLGVGALGGCCGTTPDYIKAYVNFCGKIEAIDTHKSVKIASGKGENTFSAKLSRGERVIAVELDPPEDCNLDFFSSGARTLAQAGADVITIADCPVARARMDSSLLACKLKREFSLEPLPHLTCRDRNINATKALLLGLYAEGVRNVLVVTGDPVPSALRDEVKSVYSFNSRMMASFIRTLNDSLFEAPMTICAALNVNAPNFDVQLGLAKQKVENGVSVFLTQPVMSAEAAKNLKMAHELLNAKVLCGIMPIVSHKNAVYMNNEIPGITVCDEIANLFIDREREECERIGVKVAVATARECRHDCDGFYVITPFKRVNMSAQIVREIQNFC